MNITDSEIERYLRESRDIIYSCYKLTPDIMKAAKLIITALRSGKKLLICGNGGSAADAQHIAAELVNRFKVNRRALPTIALTTDSSVLTSIGNDLEFKYIFSRQVEALAKKGDVLLVLSTSGDSVNIFEAATSAKKMGVSVIAITGDSGGCLSKYNRTNILLNIPSGNTPHIQEAGQVIYHILCWIIEESIKSDTE
jgi:phosphoheptose isomerase